ncbi:MAG: hypothetical protein H0X29_02280 [Parachlamydiaceae bacterium]|nr:hypothetical protein [Parachlamydiaceae bacterium]
MVSFNNSNPIRSLYEDKLIPLKTSSNSTSDSVSSIVQAILPQEKDPLLQNIINKTVCLSSTPSPFRVMLTPENDIAVWEESERVTSALSFFKHLNVDPNLVTSFNSNDIAQIYKMIDAQPVSYRINIYTLLGFHFSHYLNELKTLESVSLKTRKILINSLQSDYIELHTNYSNTMLKSINLINESIKNKDKKTDKFFDEFKDFLSLFLKFYNNLPLRLILENISLNFYPGISELNFASSLEGALAGGKELNLYIKLITDAILQENLLPAFDCIFKEIAEKINACDFDNIENLAKTAEQCHDITHFIAEQGEIVGKYNMIHKTKYPFIFTFLGDIMYMLQCVILLGIDPSYSELIRYEGRMVIFLFKIDNFLHQFMQKKVNKKMAHFEKFYHKTLNEIFEIKGKIKNISDKITQYYNANFFSFPYIIKDLFALSEILKDLNGDILRRIEFLTNEHSSKLKDIPLLEETALLAQLFVLSHDINMLLYGESPWTGEPYVLPLAYLNFIGLEIEKDEDNDNYSASSALSSEASSSVFPTTETTLEANIIDISSSSYLSPILTADASPPIFHRSDLTPTLTGSIEEANLEIESSVLENLGTLTLAPEPSTLVIKENLVIRNLERTLRRLGLEKEEGRSHTGWKLPLGGKLMVPRHGKIGWGLLNAIQREYNQMQENKSNQESKQNSIYLAPVIQKKKIKTTMRR